MQVGPVGFAFNYTFNVTNNNYLAASLSNGEATVSFTDITDLGVEQAITVFDGQFASTTVPGRTTQKILMSVNVTIPAVNFSNTQGKSLKLQPIDALKRVVLHDVCSKTAGKCGENTGGGDVPTVRTVICPSRANVVGAH